LSSAPEL